MSLLCIVSSKYSLKGLKQIQSHFVLNHGTRLTSNLSKNDIIEDDEFRRLELRPKRGQDQTAKRSRPSSYLRAPKTYKRVNKLDPDTVDWKSVWPGPRTFDPNAVPLPVYQGRLKPHHVPFNKHANLELMKIPNFLHLTPPAIKAHCEELKKFCSPFPKELDSKEKCEKYFPVTVITNDYLHSSPTIRDPLSRVVEVKLKLKNLPLDEHARDKLLRLVKDRYNDKTDTLTIVTDRCPMRKQNYDYAQYLLTALYFESWKVEEWESEKSEVDMEKYIWENNLSSRALASILKWTPDKLNKAVFHDTLPVESLKPEHHSYGAAVKKVIEGEDVDKVKEYKEATLKILLKKESHG